MNDPEITKMLQDILGEEAINNAGVVPENIKRLFLCVDYLSLQIGITKRWCDEQGKDHVDGVLKITKEMLSGDIKLITT